MFVVEQNAQEDFFECRVGDGPARNHAASRRVAERLEQIAQFHLNCRLFCEEESSMFVVVSIERPTSHAWRHLRAARLELRRAGERRDQRCARTDVAHFTHGSLFCFFWKGDESILINETSSIIEERQRKRKNVNRTASLSTFSICGGNVSVMRK